VDQPGISVVAEDDVLVLRKQGVVVDIAQPVRVLAGGLKLHQIDDVDHPNFQLRQMLPQDGNGRENLERRRVAAAGHHDVRLGVLVVAGPLPDANPLGAMHDAASIVSHWGRACFPPPRR